MEALYTRSNNANIMVCSLYRHKLQLLPSHPVSNLSSIRYQIPCLSGEDIHTMEVQGHYTHEVSLTFLPLLLTPASTALI